MGKGYLVLLAALLLVPGGMQYRDPCLPEGVIEQLWITINTEKRAGVEDIERWVQDYVEGECPAQVKASVRAVADAYIAMMPAAAHPPLCIRFCLFDGGWPGGIR